MKINGNPIDISRLAIWGIFGFFELDSNIFSGAGSFVFYTGPVWQPGGTQRVFPEIISKSKTSLFLHFQEHFFQKFWKYVGYF